jgi:hypothetical protein
MATELPILQCTLDAAGARDQAARYGSIAAHVTALDRDELHLLATFDEMVDRPLVEELVTVERACCAFFKIDWDAAERRLGFAVSAPDHAPALGVIAQALGA